jgi:hypothetical protein
MMLELVVEHLRPLEREFAKQSHDLTLAFCPVPAVNTTPDVMCMSNRPAQIIKPTHNMWCSLPQSYQIFKRLHA